MTHQLPSDKRVARALCDANGSKMVGGAERNVCAPWPRMKWLPFRTPGQSKSI